MKEARLLILKHLRRARGQLEVSSEAKALWAPWLSPPPALPTQAGELAQAPPLPWVAVALPHPLAGTREQE